MNHIEKYNIDVFKVLTHLPGLKTRVFYPPSSVVVSKKWKQYQVVCPFHEDKKPSLWINLEKNAYNCFVCSHRVWESKVIPKTKSIWKWTFIQFVKVFYEQVLWKEVSNLELLDLFEVKEEQQKEFLKDMSYYNSTNTWSSTKSYVKKETTLEQNLPYNILEKYYGKNDTYLKSRLLWKNDITEQQYKDTLEHFLLWTTEKWDIVIPIIQNYKLYGTYVRRNVEKWKEVFWEWKYFIIETFKKTNKIFNWDFVSKYDSIILVEGPLNAIRLWSLWYKNVVSSFWALLNPEQLEQLKTKKNILVWYDSDTAGDQGIQDLLQIKWDVKIYKASTEWKTDAYDYTKKEIEEILKQIKKIK